MGVAERKPSGSREILLWSRISRDKDGSLPETFAKLVGILVILLKLPYEASTEKTKVSVQSSRLCT